jgi:hypothetical protein
MKWMIALAVLTWQAEAHACGCFTQPNVQTPVVQAGERILFAHEGGNLVAYIQIQYQGSADHFGWLVPLPSVPTLELGTDEVFTQLGNVTQPTFTLTTNNICTGVSYSSSSSSGIGCGGEEDFSAEAPAQDLGIPLADGAAQMNPVVVQSSIGPYDYAVLKADDQTEMTKWLNDNGYFVPDATGQAVKPYLHSGAFFLALKLQAGQSTGDIVPIVLRYASDLPMIPITLTSVGAVPNMGILVWVLGGSRAIPRNYHHTVLDDMPIWLGANYQQQIISAVKEAPGHHSFVTEYAGPATVMSQRIYYPGRFGDLTVARTITDPINYMHYLRNNGYVFDSTLLALLERFIPEPQQAVIDGIPESEFYTNFDMYWNYYATSGDGGAPFVFDGAGLTDAIEMRIVVPDQDAQALFDKWPTLTRLYTTISPEDMNLDPVFSENPDLPAVPLDHHATVTVPCNSNSWLSDDQGFEVQYRYNTAPTFPTPLPPTLRLETLREAGQPIVESDNSTALKTQLGPVTHDSGSSSSSSSSSSGGCDISPRSRNQLGTAFFFLVGILIVARRRRRA